METIIGWRSCGLIKSFKSAGKQSSMQGFSPQHLFAHQFNFFGPVCSCLYKQKIKIWHQTMWLEYLSAGFVFFCQSNECVWPHCPITSSTFCTITLTLYFSYVLNLLIWETMAYKCVHYWISLSKASYFEKKKHQITCAIISLSTFWNAVGNRTMWTCSVVVVVQPVAWWMVTATPLQRVWGNRLENQAVQFISTHKPQGGLQKTLLSL